jgi:hypothetical protein
MTTGAKVWCFPDGYLPEKVGGGTMEAHESVVLLNPGDEPANVKIDFFFENREPTRDVPVVVEARRIKSVRMDHPAEIGGLCIPPLTQYAILIRSDQKIVAQFGRLETAQANMAYYIGVGYCEG